MRVELFDKGFKEILATQSVSVTGGLLAGTVLAAYTDKLLFVPGMLVLLPGFLEMRGNISGTLSARLSSGLFLKVINPKKMRTKLVAENLAASFFLAVLASLALGTVAFLFNLLATGVATPRIVALPLLAGIIANAVEIPLALAATFYLFRKGHDPNNIMGPFVTSTGDITSILALLAAMVVL